MTLKERFEDIHSTSFCFVLLCFIINHRALDSETALGDVLACKTDQRGMLWPQHGSS